MMIPEVQYARDYNRGLPAPIRWVHIAAALAAWLVRPVWRWAEQPHRRSWAVPALFGVVLAVAVGVFDGALTRGVRGGILWRPDLAGVLSWSVLFGSGVVGAVIWLQDPGKRGRVLDWVAGAVMVLGVGRLMSMTVGRPRPLFDDPGYFINLLGSYPVGPGLGIRHAWEFWARGVWNLWSMPALEAGYAAAGAVIVGTAYPRLRPLAVGLGAVVVVGVVVTGLGYASDAVVGAALGAGMARRSLDRRWGGLVRQVGRL